MSVSFSPNGQILATSQDSSIRLWSVDQAPPSKPCQDIPLGKGSCLQPRWSNLASGSEDHTIRLWEIRTGICRQTLQGHTGYHHSALVPMVKRLPVVVRMLSGLWNVQDGTCQTCKVTAVVWEVAFNRLVKPRECGSADRSARLDVQGGTCLKTFQGRTKSFSQL